MCHMGSDRKVRKLASELVQELSNKWHEVLSLIRDIECPFVEELEERTGTECLIGSDCEKCLAQFSLCKEYMRSQAEIRRRVFTIITDLKTER